MSHLGLVIRRFKSTPSCKMPPVSHNHHLAYLPRRLLARVDLAHVVLASLLVVALLWTQGLGLWHRQVHSGIGHAAHPTASLGKLFSHHQTDTDCRLYDQLSHADGAPALLAIAPALLALPPILQASHGLAVARWHALFQARGPPSVR